MKKWILKAIVQKTISFLPYKHRLNFFFQKYVTRGVQLSDDYFEDRLGHAARHLHFFEKHGGQINAAHTLELGTGWYPVVPISMFLAGAEAAFSIDIDGLTNRERVLTTIQKFVDFEKEGRLAAIFPKSKPERLAILQSITKSPPPRFLKF